MCKELVWILTKNNFSLHVLMTAKFALIHYLNNYLLKMHFNRIIVINYNYTIFINIVSISKIKGKYFLLWKSFYFSGERKDMAHIWCIFLFRNLNLLLPCNSVQNLFLGLLKHYLCFWCLSGSWISNNSVKHIIFKMWHLKNPDWYSNIIKSL